MFWMKARQTVSKKAIFTNSQAKEAEKWEEQEATNDTKGTSGRKPKHAFNTRCVFKTNLCFSELLHESCEQSVFYLCSVPIILRCRASHSFLKQQEAKGVLLTEPVRDKSHPICCQVITPVCTYTHTGCDISDGPLTAIPQSTPLAVWSGPTKRRAQRPRRLERSPTPVCVRLKG